MMTYDPLDADDVPRYEVDDKAQDDFVWLMRHVQGRRIVRLLLADAGVWRSTFDPDPHRAAFNEGMRAQGLRLLSAVSRTDEFDLILKGEADE